MKDSWCNDEIGKDVTSFALKSSSDPSYKFDGSSKKEREHGSTSSVERTTRLNQECLEQLGVHFYNQWWQSFFLGGSGKKIFNEFDSLITEFPASLGRSCIPSVYTESIEKHEI